MPFPLHLFNPQSFPRLTARRVALVRFVRAVSGFAQIDASDPDDRGFNLDPVFANVHGPAFGIAGPDGANPAQECRIRVLRDRLEPAVQLFPEIVDTGLVTQVFPAVGAALNPNPVPGRDADTIVVKAARAPVSATNTTLKLHFGSATGPVVGECAIRVCPLLTIPCKGHLVTINGGSPTSVEQDFVDIINNANKILIAAGIKLDFQPGVLTEDHLGFTTANTMTFLNTGHFDFEMAKIMRKNPQPGVLNVYIVGHITMNTQDDVNGLGISSDFANRNPPAGTYVGAQVGFVMRDPDEPEGFAQTFAHELGHVLTLEHYDNKNGAAVISNNWSQRNLMFNFAQLTTGAPRDQIGYGPRIGTPNPTAGMWVGIKQLARINQSQQSDLMRTGVLNGTFMPI